MNSTLMYSNEWYSNVVNSTLMYSHVIYSTLLGRSQRASLSVRGCLANPSA